MSARIFIESALRGGAEVALPQGAARHVQVLRLQPGAPLVLFDGEGGEWAARVTHMGRADVRVLVGGHTAIERELARHVTLAIGMPANERMDTLIEKSTELGVAEIVPLMCERAVLRLHDERAQRKLVHWRGITVAACEQSGRTRLPRLQPVATLEAWLQSLPAAGAADASARWLLSLDPQACGVSRALAASVGLMPGGGLAAIRILSGPEGGLSAAEQALAVRSGFTPVNLGPRVLRADTAPLAALAVIACDAR